MAGSRSTAGSDRVVRLSTSGKARRLAVLRAPNTAPAASRHRVWLIPRQARTKVVKSALIRSPRRSSLSSDVMIEANADSPSASGPCPRPRQGELRSEPLAKSWAFSVRTGPANPRRCASSPASSRPRVCGQRMKVHGYDVFDDPLEVRRNIGYLPQRAPLYGEMSVWEYLTFIADMRGLDQSTFKRRNKVQHRRRLWPRPGARQGHPRPLARLPAARRARAGAGARPADPHPRRADGRPRPEREGRGHPLHQGDRQGPHRPPLHPQPRRGRGRVRAGDHRLQGPRRRRRAARRDPQPERQGPLRRHRPRAEGLRGRRGLPLRRPQGADGAGGPGRAGGPPRRDQRHRAPDRRQGALVPDDGPARERHSRGDLRARGPEGLAAPRDAARLADPRGRVQGPDQGRRAQGPRAASSSRRKTTTRTRTTPRPPRRPPRSTTRKADEEDDEDDEEEEGDEEDADDEGDDGRRGRRRSRRRRSLRRRRADGTR